MMDRRRLSVLLAVANLTCCWLATGCSRQAAQHEGRTTPVVTGAGEKAGTGDTTTDTVPGRTITLREADTKVFDEVLQQHHGKVVLVDFWATWCVPCKKNFPKILAFGRKYADQGLVLMSVSMDAPSNSRETLKFLTSVEARTDNLISTWGTSTESAERFEFDGAVPYYKLYDRAGTLRYEFSGNPEGLDNVEDVDRIESRIKELLAPEG